jgi:hypothetical protein
LIALAASFLSLVSLIITGLFVHWCGALEHIGDVDDGTLMLPSMWSIDSLTIPQTGAEEALCWVEKKTLDKKLRFKYIDQNSINNWNKSKKTGREASSSLDQSIHKNRHHTASVCVLDAYMPTFPVST